MRLQVLQLLAQQVISEKHSDDGLSLAPPVDIIKQLADFNLDLTRSDLKRLLVNQSNIMNTVESTSVIGISTCHITC
jgi:hypothetical protein